MFFCQGANTGHWKEALQLLAESLKLSGVWGDLFFVGENKGGSGLFLKACHFLELSKGKIVMIYILIYMLDLGHATFIDVAMYC